MFNRSMGEVKGGENSFYTMILMTNVLRAMRKDIGLSNCGLRSGAIRLMRPLINDYDMAIRPREVGLLSSARTALNTVLKRGAKDGGAEK